MRQKVVVLLLLVLLASAFLLAQTRRRAAPTARPAGLIVVMTDTGFQPNVLVLEGQSGAKMTIEVRNESKNPHGLRIELGGQNFGLDAPLGPGKTTRLEITIPAEGAVGTFYSPVGNDRKNGFQGRAMTVGGAVAG